MASTQTNSSERSLDGKHLVRLVATDQGTCAERYLDNEDQAIVDERLATMNAQPGPRVGDFVIFADGVERRISHDWGDVYQTSDLTGLWSGRFHLTACGCSYSGGLRPGLPADRFSDTGETRDGSAWIFHHDHHRAHNGVDFKAPFRVFRCSMVAN